MLRRGGEVADLVRERFGFRSIETRAGRIYLNGQPLFLRGALDQDYYPDGICTPPSEAFLEDQFRKAKALGLNCLRCHIKVPDPRYYAVADRVGLLIWTELPGMSRLTAQARVRAEATLHGILERDGNHPSIFCWTIINENWGTDLVHSAEIAPGSAARWTGSRPPTPTGSWSTTRRSRRASICAPISRTSISMPRFRTIGAAGTGSSRRLRPAGWTYGPAAEVVRTGDEPLLCSEFGNWGLPDPERLRGADGAEPWWFETGHNWGDGAAYPHGIENRFRAAGLERVFGSVQRLRRGGAVAATVRSSTRSRPCAGSPPGT